MDVFCHHIYEYKKGLRDLVLHTAPKSEGKRIVEKLEQEGIQYIMYPVEESKINVFFGNEICIEIIKTINKKSLLDYTAEEDFILGIMLGYDRVNQYERYVTRKKDRKDV